MSEDNEEYIPFIKYMNLRSVEENMEGIEPFFGTDDRQSKAYLEYSFPEMLEKQDDEFWDLFFPRNPDGSRDAGPNTIITKEAWARAVGGFEHRVGRSYQQRLAEQYYALMEPDRKIHWVINTPRQYGSKMYSVIDEWSYSLWGRWFIDITLLKDEKYMTELKSDIMERLGTDETSSIHASFPVRDHDDWWMWSASRP